MKTRPITHYFLACFVVLASMQLVSCDGRANILDDPSMTDDPTVIVELINANSTSMRFVVRVNNYYDHSQSRFDLESAGVVYRKLSESESRNEKVERDCSGQTTYVEIYDLSWGTQYNVTPFVVDDDGVTYYGSEVVFKTRGN